MANYVTGVNPAVLKWARERAGFSLSEVAQSLGKAPETIAEWESGNSLPTYNQLEKLAYSLYKRPIAIFFFPTPPEEPEAAEAFRTLPQFELDALLPDTRHAIRQARAFQVALRELCDGKNPAPRQIIRSVQVRPSDSIRPSASVVRTFLRTTLEQQTKWKTYDYALENWREAVQDCGVFVFKRAFKQDDISGFCLSDEEFPVIYLSNSTAKARQIFSLFHELGHLMLRTSGVTMLSDRYIDALSGDARAIEVFCNRFTAEFLVPSEDFQAHFSASRPLQRETEHLADRYKVSREVILRKLLDRGIVDAATYDSWVPTWEEEYRKSREGRGPGGDYYATQATYLGHKYLSLAFSKYYQGACSVEQLADYLNVKVASIPGLEHHALQRESAT